MSKIQSFPKSKLQMNELLAAGRSVETKILAVFVSTTAFKLQFEKFQKTLNDYDDSLIRLRKSYYTGQKDNLGKKRTNTRSGLAKQIRSYECFAESETIKAQKSLMTIVDQYKGIERHSFDNQTGSITNMIQILESAPYLDYVKLLKLEKWIEALKEINEECADVAIQLLKENSERNSPKKTHITRPLFCNAYDALVIRLNALAEVNGDTDYVALFSWWNAMIDSYRITISLRHGSGSGGKTDSGNSGRHDPDSGPSKEEEDRPVIN